MAYITGHLIGYSGKRTKILQALNKNKIYEMVADITGHGWLLHNTAKIVIQFRRHCCCCINKLVAESLEDYLLQCPALVAHGGQWETPFYSIGIHTPLIYCRKNYFGIRHSSGKIQNRAALKALNSRTVKSRCTMSCFLSLTQIQAHDIKLYWVPDIATHRTTS